MTVSRVADELHEAAERPAAAIQSGRFADNSLPFDRVIFVHVPFDSSVNGTSKVLCLRLDPPKRFIDKDPKSQQSPVTWRCRRFVFVDLPLNASFNRVQLKR